MVSSRLRSHNRAQAARRFCAPSPAGNAVQRRGQNFQLHAFHRKQSLILFHQGIFRLGEDIDERFFD